jgi:hypothetical protein
MALFIAAQPDELLEPHKSRVAAQQHKCHELHKRMVSLMEKR